MNILALLDQPRTYAELAQQIPPNQLDTRLAALKRQRRIVQTKLADQWAWVRPESLTPKGTEKFQVRPPRQCCRCGETKQSSEFGYHKKACRACSDVRRCRCCGQMKALAQFKPKARYCAVCAPMREAAAAQRKREKERLRYAKRSAYANRRLAELA